MRYPNRPSRRLLALLLALSALAAACSGGDNELSSPTTIIVEDSGGTDGAEGSVELPTVDDSDDDGSSDTTQTTSDASDTSDASTADTSTDDTGVEEQNGSEATSSDDTVADSDTSFTSSPPPTGEKKGCPEGMVLVGSNGEEPICEEPGGGCPDPYNRLIGGVDGAALCQDDGGNVVRVYPDGTVTPDTSVPFNGPVCRRTDENGNIVELSLAVDQATCEERGGEYLPDGL